MQIDSAEVSASYPSWLYLNLLYTLSIPRSNRGQELPPEPRQLWHS